jgi:hypothetical protein
MSSGAPLTILFNFITNPVIEPSLPLSLVGRRAEVGDDSELLGLVAAMVNLSSSKKFFFEEHNTRGGGG